MARNYSLILTDTAPAINTTLGQLTSAATIRPMIYDILISCRVAPADAVQGYSFRRYTVAGGTPTAVTPQALDPADPASLLASSTGQMPGSEPTYTANATLFEIDVNQRAAFRWIAAPGKELKMPATAANGIGIVELATAASLFPDVLIHFEE